jgi:hypothetical protein
VQTQAAPCLLFAIFALSFSLSKISPRDHRRLDVGVTVQMMRPVSPVPPGYMVGHTFVPLLKVLDYFN